MGKLSLERWEKIVLLLSGVTLSAVAALSSLDDPPRILLLLVGALLALVALFVPRRDTSAQAGAGPGDLDVEAEQRLAGLKHLVFVSQLEAWMRAALAGALVVGTFVVVAYGLLVGQAESLAELLTPLAGLTGLAIGYFFGQATRDADIARLGDHDDSKRPR
jgi:hypothetical protein